MCGCVCLFVCVCVCVCAMIVVNERSPKNAFFHSLTLIFSSCKSMQFPPPHLCKVYLAVVVRHCFFFSSLLLLLLLLLAVLQPLNPPSSKNLLCSLCSLSFCFTTTKATTKLDFLAVVGCFATFLLWCFGG